jgi:cephalosporin hydroxylase
MKLNNLGKNFFKKTVRDRYSYRFTFKGVPIIQYPQDIVSLQEIIWKIKPELIIDVGIAHGGSLLFNASILNLINQSEKKKVKRKVLGIEIKLKKKNKKRIINDSLASYIDIIEGSSTDKETQKKVLKYTKDKKKILVILDSNHTHEHVLKELEFYGKLVSKGSYCVVFDTIIELMPKNFYKDRDWDRGNNPYTAVHSFLKKNKKFKIDKKLQEKLEITAALDGYLKRVK